MSRRVILSIVAAAAVLLVGVGVVAGVLITGNNESAKANDGPAYLGASLQNLPFDVANVVIGVDNGGPAAKAGLTFGDSIRSLDGQKITTHEDVDRVVATKKPGDTVSMAYWRLGDTKNVDVKLATAPKDPNQTRAGDLEFGTVKSASDKSVKVGLALSNKEVTYEVTKATRFWRSFEAIKASDLKEGDSVMVISVDGGKSALTGLAHSN